MILNEEHFLQHNQKTCNSPSMNIVEPYYVRP